MYRIMNLLFIFSADCIGDDDIGTKGDADKQIQDQTDERAVCSDGSNRGGTLGTGKITYDSNIGGIKLLF